MLDQSARADAPTEPDARPVESHLGRDDLRARLGRMPDGHPAAADYRPSADDRPGAGDQNADTPGRPGEPKRPDSSPETPDDRREQDYADSRSETRGARGDTEHTGSGWDAPGYRSHPDRPVVSEIHVPSDRAGHILDGDGRDKPGGGHRHGTGLPDKTEFPEAWSDKQTLSTIEQVARDPDAIERQSNARWRVTGERDGVRVWAVVLDDGAIWTAWPEPGGPGVTRNPKDGGT